MASFTTEIPLAYGRSKVAKLLEIPRAVYTPPVSNRSTVIVSDAHLGYGPPETATQFHQFLEMVPDLGDHFAKETFAGPVRGHHGFEIGDVVVGTPSGVSGA